MRDFQPPDFCAAAVLRRYRVESVLIIRIFIIDKAGHGPGRVGVPGLLVRRGHIEGNLDVIVVGHIAGG